MAFDLFSKYKELLSGAQNLLSKVQTPSPQEYAQKNFQSIPQVVQKAAPTVQRVGNQFAQSANQVVQGGIQKAYGQAPIQVPKILQPLTILPEVGRKFAQGTLSDIAQRATVGTPELRDAMNVRLAQGTPQERKRYIEGNIEEGLNFATALQAPINKFEVNKSVQLLRNKLNKSDIDVIGKFAELVETGKDKRNLGELGRTMASLTENVFGPQARTWTNRQIKNAFDLVLGKIGQKSNTAGLGLNANPLRDVLEAEATKGTQIFPSRTQSGTGQPSATGVQRPSVRTTPTSVSQTGQTTRMSTSQNQPLDDIIAQGRSEIAPAVQNTDKRTIKEALSDFYTQWVDRYHPIVKASQKAKSELRAKGAELLPQNDPEYLVRRLTGAGGIADARFRRELEPIIKQLDALKIDKLDMDTYLVNKRIAGFGQVGRDIYGADPVKARAIVAALEQKYGQNIQTVADQLYRYQDKGFRELAEDFLRPEDLKLIQSQNPDYAPLKRRMDEIEEYLGLPTRKTMQGTQPVKKIVGSKRQIESPLETIIANTFSQRAAIEKNRVAKSIIGLQNVVDLGFRRVSEASDNTMTIWNKGQKEFWSVGRDVADVAKGVNEESMNMVLKILQAPASLLRQGATGRNPEFMGPNIIRDQLDAGISSKYGYIPFVDYISGLKSMITGDDIYRRWESSGAKIDLGEMSGRKSITQYFDEKKARKNLFQWIGSGLDLAGSISEQPTRVGLFKKAFQKTGNELIAAMESRDSTVDFARMGSKMKVANSIIPFLNVGVQGFDKLIRAVQNNPAKVAFMAGVYGAAPAAALTVYNLLNHPEEYAEIPQYEKDSNFVFVNGRNERGTVDYFTIPKGNIVPVIANPVQSFIEFVHGSSSQSFGQLAATLLSETLPVLSAGSTPKEIALKTIGSNIPQAVKPLAENLLNKSFYKYDAKKEQSKEIVPYFLQNKPAYQQKYDFTPKMYEKIGAALNVSPLQVQNLLEGYLAGYSKVPSQMIEAMYKTSRGEEVGTNEKTLLRRFMKETYPTSGAPPPVKSEAPGLMERLTGKASAAEKVDTPEQIKQKDLQARDKLRYSKDYVLEERGKIFVKKDTEAGVSIDMIDPTFMPEKPILTGQTELDKKLISQYHTGLSNKEKDVVKLFELGKLTSEQAELAIAEIRKLKIKATGTGRKKGRAPSIKIPTLKLPKITKSTVKKISLPKPRKTQVYKLRKPKIKKTKIQVTRKGP